MIYQPKTAKVSYLSPDLRAFLFITLKWIENEAENCDNGHIQLNLLAWGTAIMGAIYAQGSLIYSIQ
jgi:hypothetical protein